VVPTGPDGRFRLLGCTPGQVRVEVRAEGPFVGLPLAVGVTEAGCPLRDLVVSPPRAFLRLRVVRPDPELPCQLEVREIARDRGIHVMVPASGEVRVGPLPAGSYLVRHTYLADPPRFLHGLDLGPIDLAAGEERDLGVHSLAAPNALRLVLRRTDGTPVRPPSITLSPSGGDERPFVAHLDERGRLWPRSFPPGRYRLHVDAGLDHMAGDLEVEIEPARTTVATLDLVPLRPCRFHFPPPFPAMAIGEVRDPAGAGTQVQFRQGRAEVGLPRGRYRLVVGGRVCATFVVETLSGSALAVDGSWR